MSGLVFVRDAQTRPLMPTSAAYARTLLYKRKAQRVPHPAFNIIQLTSIVPEPVLRPVVVNIFLHRQAVYLSLLTEHLRGTISSLSIIVDLTILNHTRQSRPVGLRPRSHHRRHSASFASMLVVRQQTDLLATLITTLQTIIPISHFIVLATPRTNTSSSRIARYTESSLTHYLASLNAPIMLVRPADLQATLSPELSQAVQRAGAATDIKSPDLVACFLNVLGLRGRFSLRPRAKDDRQQRNHPSAGRNQSFSDIQPGQLCTFWYLGRTRTGFVTSMNRDVLLVRIAVTATPSGIRWRKVRIHVHQIRDLWPIAPTLLLPLARIPSRSDSV